MLFMRRVQLFKARVRRALQAFFRKIYIIFAIVRGGKRIINFAPLAIRYDAERIIRVRFLLVPLVRAFAFYLSERVA